MPGRINSNALKKQTKTMKSSIHWKTIVVSRSKECDTKAGGGTVNRNTSKGEWNN